MKNIPIVILAILLAACGGGGGGGNNAKLKSDPTSSSKPVSVTLSPATDQTVPAGNSITFKATVQNATDTAVSWKVNDVTGGNVAIGTITSAGVYTAPKVPPVGGVVTITAVSKSDADASASTTVAITFSNASLAGDFIFEFSGQGGMGDFAALGRLHADGHGKLSGVEDYNGPEGVFQDIGFDGSYNINGDGTGMAAFNSSHGPTTARLLIVSATTAEMIEFDGTASAVGQMLAQGDVTGVSNSLKANNYVFSLSGSSTVSAETDIAGLIYAADAGGDFSGEEDRNDNGTIDADAALVGSYAIDSDGRGAATITDSHGTNHYRLYAISDGEIELLSLDPGVVFSGSAQQQTYVGAFDKDIFAGNYVFVSAGESAEGDIATAGRFSADGAGNIVSGIQDRNNAGIVTSDSHFNGTYAVGADGRGQISWGNGSSNSTFTFYAISEDESVWLETDGVVASGTIYSQSGQFSTAAVKGHFGFFGAAIAGGNPAANLGVVTADGSGHLSGSEVIDDAGVLSPNLSLTGTYDLAANGRGTVSINTNGGATANYVLYGVVPQVLILLGVDSGTAAAGLVAKQY